MRNFKGRVRSCSVAVLFISCAVHAQSVPKNEKTATNGESASAHEIAPVGDVPPSSADIVVTAQGRAQKLQDVPVSVTSTTGVALVRSNITNLEALSLRLPNFKIATASISDFVVVRGVGSSLNLGFEQSVGTFVDGLYRGRARTTRSGLFDVERVELLKGPQTTFFGNNAIAGAINITTRKPGKEFAANGTAFYAPGTGEFTLEAGVSVPLTNRLSIRVAGRESGMDGYIHNTNLNNDGPHLRDRVGRLSMVWEPLDIFEINARIDVGHNRDTGVADYELLQCPPDPAFGPPAAGCARFLAFNGGMIDDKLNRNSGANYSYFNYDFVEGAWNSKISIGRHTLSFNTGYFYHKYSLLYDPAPIPATQGGSVVGTSETIASEINEKYEQFSQEIRLASPVDSPVSYLAGLYYQTSKLQVDTFGALFFAPFGAFSGGAVSANTPLGYYIPSEEKNQVFSAFGAATINFNSALRLNLGLRYSRVRESAKRTPFVGTTGSIPSIRNFNPLPLAAQALLLPRYGTDPGNYAVPQRSDQKILPTASLQYDLNHNIMAYGSYTKGFKAGGYSIGTANASFGPESVDAFEIGVKSALFNRHLTFNIASFYSKYENLQQTSTILSTGGLNTRQVVGNVGSSISKGIELSTSFRASSQLTISSDIAYLSSKYDSFLNGPCASLQAATILNCQQNLSGKDAAFAPRFSGNVSASYNKSVSGSLEVKVDTSLYFTSRFFQQPTSDPRLTQPGNAKLDIRFALGRIDQRWEVAVVGKNIINKLTASYRQIVPSAIGSIAALADPPRSIGLQISARY